MKQLLPAFFLAIIGCNKEDHSVKSSEKSISNVTFKKSDNPGLSTDIEGVVTSDSIKFDIPQNTSITSLIPTIEFKGQKIEPANRTAQDFTNGIRYKITAEDGSTSNYFFRVARISSDTSVLILGNWKVIKDSVVNNNWINPAGGVLNDGVYMGTPLDYWKFESNGIFSMRENNIIGSGAYSITPDNKLDIPVWSIQYGRGTIETLTNTNFTVYFHATSVNGGHYFRKVYLKR